MSYNFKEIEKKVYPKTFLKDVQILLEFDGCVGDVVTISEFIKSNFNLSVNGDLIYKGIVINTEDTLIKFQFEQNLLKLTMRHPAYKQFAFALRWMPIILSYLQIVHVDGVKRLAISKYNELGYTLSGNIDVAEIMRQVFSDELLNQGESKEWEQERMTFVDMTRWEKFGSIEGNDQWNSAFSYEYGFCRKANSNNTGSLTLKTIMESKNVAIELTELENVMIAFNDVLDRGFHWCVNENIIKKMEE